MHTPDEYEHLPHYWMGDREFIGPFRVQESGGSWAIAETDENRGHYLVWNTGLPNTLFPSLEAALADVGLTPFSAAPQGEDPEPTIDDSVKCCPDCEQPNQFGELCPSCQHERQIEIEANR